MSFLNLGELYTNYDKCSLRPGSVICPRNASLHIASGVTSPSLFGFSSPAMLLNGMGMAFTTLVASHSAFSRPVAVFAVMYVSCDISCYELCSSTQRNYFYYKYQIRSSMSSETTIYQCSLLLVFPGKSMNFHSLCQFDMSSVRGWTSQSMFNSGKRSCSSAARTVSGLRYDGKWFSRKLNN